MRLPALIRRLAQGLLLLLLVASATFALVHAAPGEPFASQVDDPRVTPAMRATLRRQYGLDQPLAVQYVRYVRALASGDLGRSLARQRPVRALLADAVPRTILLGGTALLLAAVAGIAVGVRQARAPGSRFDRITTRACVALAAIPDFWLALGLIAVFSVRLGWTPVSGMADPVTHDFLSPLARLADTARHLALPALTLALLLGAAIARQQREALLAVLPERFVRTARGKGAPDAAVLRRHALPHALRPTIVLLGLALPSLLGGVVFIEAIFDWPGMGRLALDALAARDYPVVLGATVVGSALVVLGTLAADLALVALDPRGRDA